MSRTAFVKAVNKPQDTALKQVEVPLQPQDHTRIAVDNTLLKIVPSDDGFDVVLAGGVEPTKATQFFIKTLKKILREQQ